MAEVNLDLVVLHRALVVLHCALDLLDQLFLVVQLLARNRVPRPRRLVSRDIHLRLRQHALVPLKNSLRLHQRRSVRTRINLDQRIALAHHRPSRKWTSVTIPFTWLVIDDV